MPKQKITNISTCVIEQTQAGASLKQIAQETNTSTATISRARAVTGTRGTPGRRQVSGQVAEEVMRLAREGMQRKVIAKQLELAESTVKRIALEADFSFLRGRPSKS